MAGMAHRHLHASSLFVPWMLSLLRLSIYCLPVMAVP